VREVFNRGEMSVNTLRIVTAVLRGRQLKRASIIGGAKGPLQGKQRRGGFRPNKKIGQILGG